MASTTELPLIRLHDLRLNDACALLEHDSPNALPDPQESPLSYVQSIVDGLCELSMRDPLTGLANRRHFQNVLSKEIDMVARSGESALLLILDIDHFKKVNDTYGHHVGDQVLQAVSKCLDSCVRPKDTVSRFGGEEFAVILPNCSVSFGSVVAERFRKNVSALSIAVSPQVNIQVTISIGGAFAPEWVRSTTTLWLERADEQLYRAKAAGRNRAYIEEPREIAVSAEEKNMLFGNLLIGDPDTSEDDSKVTLKGEASDRATNRAS